VPDSQNPVTQLQQGQGAIPEPGQFSASEDPNQTVARQKIKNATAAAPKGVKSAGSEPTEPPPTQSGGRLSQIPVM
jgi:hypothetical protein